MGSQMRNLITRFAVSTSAVALLVSQAALGQTQTTSSPIPTPAMVAPAGPAATLDLGDCPDIASGFEIGKSYACACPPSVSAEAPAGTVYGTLVYAYDSNICTAAVHAGALKRATAGRVSLQMIDSPPVFKGSTQNGVKSDVLATASAAAFQFSAAR